MKSFPGRFLEEIDEIDYGRVSRAWAAEHVEAIEAKRLADLSLGNMTEREQASLLEHEQWLRQRDGV